MAVNPLLPQLLLLALLAPPLVGQVPDATFFKGDPKAVMLHCAAKARSLKPKNQEAIAAEARAFLLAGERAKAEFLFLALEKMSPEADTYVLIASTWLKCGLTEPVPTLIEKVCLRGAKDAGALTHLAIVLMNHGLVEEAMRIMDLAYAADRKADSEFVEFACACIRAGHEAAAPIWFERAIAVKPRNERRWLDIAMALADHGLEH